MNTESKKNQRSSSLANSRLLEMGFAAGAEDRGLPSQSNDDEFNLGCLELSEGKKRSGSD